MPELSVVIPTYNRAGRLRACLEALGLQTLPVSDFEIIVVIDGSTDGTAEMLAGLNPPYALHILHQENSGQNIARNRGVTAARGRYCLFIDDDIIASRQLLAEHLRVHQEQKNVVGIGQITITLPSNADWFMREFARGWRKHYKELNNGVAAPDWQDCYGGNLSLSRTAFLEAGGFAPDVRRSHDVELGYRLAQLGLSFVYIPGASGDQHEHKGIREFARDAAASGAGWITLCQRHPAMQSELIGPLSDAGQGERLMRRALSQLRTPPHFLNFMGELLQRYNLDGKWHQFLSRYFYWRGVRRAVTNRGVWQGMMQAVPILMYHAFAGPGESASRYVLPVRSFARQLAWLKRRNYHVLALDDYLHYRRTYRLLPPRSVVITLDDGYVDNWELAYPLLRRYSFPATMFPVSGKVGQKADWTDDRALNGRSLLSWSQMRVMSRGGIRFGAHTRTHPLLQALSPQALYEEVCGSKQDLERELDMPITTFAYPYGEFDAAAEAVVAEAGFMGGCTVDEGLNSLATPVFKLRRIEVPGTISLPYFILALSCGYVPALRQRALKATVRTKQIWADIMPSQPSRGGDS